MLKSQIQRGSNADAGFSGFQVVSEGFRWFQKVSERRNKHVKHLKLFSITNADFTNMGFFLMHLLVGTGFQPAVRAWSLPVGKCCCISPRLLKVMASSQSSFSLLIAIANAIAIVIAIDDSPSQMPRLEAYTLSNRGRSLRIADRQSAGWKPVPTSRCIRKNPKLNPHIRYPWSIILK